MRGFHYPKILLCFSFLVNPSFYSPIACNHCFYSFAFKKYSLSGIKHYIASEVWLLLPSTLNSSVHLQAFNLQRLLLAYHCMPPRILNCIPCSVRIDHAYSILFLLCLTSLMSFFHFFFYNFRLSYEISVFLFLPLFHQFLCAVCNRFSHFLSFTQNIGLTTPLSCALHFTHQRAFSERVYLVEKNFRISHSKKKLLCH